MYSATSEFSGFRRSDRTPVTNASVALPSAGTAPPESWSPWKLNRTFPCQSFVPLLVITLITPPVAPPYSAV